MVQVGADRGVDVAVVLREARAAVERTAIPGWIRTVLLYSVQRLADNEGWTPLHTVLHGLLPFPGQPLSLTYTARRCLRTAHRLQLMVLSQLSLPN